MEQEFVSLISNVGFPIVVCIFMYRMINNQLKENTTAINNNTQLMTKILTYLEAKDRSEIDGK